MYSLLMHMKDWRANWIILIPKPRLPLGSGTYSPENLSV